MRKLPRNLDNPVDNLLIDIADEMSPYAKLIDITPNGITTLALISAVLSIFAFTQKQYKASGILFFASYFFDCLDGHFARKYDMMTIFGDYYDHILDICKTVIILIMLFYVLYIKHYLVLIILIVLLGVLELVHFGCQERYVKETNNKILSGSMSILQPLCPVKQYYDQETKNIENIIGWTRFVGSGTFMLVISAVIFSLDKFT